MIPTVIIVGADKGGVGKTTLARTLLDYFALKQVGCRAFDGQWPGGTLLRFNQATIVDLSRVEGRMEVFDGAEAAGVTLVDLAAGALSQMIAALDEAKLLEEVKAGRMRLVLFHVLGPTFASVNEVESVNVSLGGNVHYFMVKNYTSAAGFFEWDKGAMSEMLAHHADQLITIPTLENRPREMIEVAGGSFVAFGQGGPSLTLRGVVRSWCERVWAEFDRVKLLDLLR